MDSSRAKTFQQMADELGIRHKLMYTLREASRVTGVPYDTLRIECKAGRLRSQLPEGRKVGRMVRPEWVGSGSRRERMASRLLRCAAYIALLFAVYALMPYVLRAMLLAADGIRVALGMGSVL